MTRLRRASDGLTAARVSGVAAGLVLVVYVFFVGTSPGRTLDESVVGHDLTGIWDQLADTIMVLVGPPTIVIALGAMIWVALRAGRPADGIRAVVLVAASALAAIGLEAVLAGLDPLAGEEARALGDSFYPSGHAAVVMSLALAAVLVAPARNRSTVTWAGGIWSSVSGFAIYAEGSHHHPSDVLASFLLALALASLAVIKRSAPHEPVPPRRPLLSTRVAVVLGSIAGASLVLELVRRASIELGPLEPSLLLAGAVISAVAFVIVATYARVLDRQSRSCEAL